MIHISCQEIFHWGRHSCLYSNVGINYNSLIFFTSLRRIVYSCCFSNMVFTKALLYWLWLCLKTATWRPPILGSIQPTALCGVSICIVLSFSVYVYPISSNGVEIILRTQSVQFQCETYSLGKEDLEVRAEGQNGMVSSLFKESIERFPSGLDEVITETFHHAFYHKLLWQWLQKQKQTGWIQNQKYAVEKVLWKVLHTYALLALNEGDMDIVVSR